MDRPKSENVPMFLRHSSDLVFEYVTNRSDEVVSLQKRMCMSQSQMVNILTFGTDATFRIMLVLSEQQWSNCLEIQTFLSTPQKFGESMKTVACAHDFEEIRVFLTHGGRSVIRAFLEAPQELVAALQTMASAHGFQESSMIVLLTHGNALAVQALLTSPEKIAAVISIFDKHKLADSGMIRVLLTHGGRSVIRAFLEAPQDLATALQTMASAHGFQESSLIVLLSHGNALAV